jgi:hypothetical protein
MRLMSARTTVRLVVATTGICAVGGLGLQPAAAWGATCGSFGIGTVCIAPIGTGVTGYFDNDKGAANTGHITILNATTGLVARTCATERVAAGDQGTMCNHATLTGNQYIAQFTTQSGGVIQTPPLTGPS